MAYLQAIMASEEGRMEASSQAETLQQTLNKVKEDMKEDKERAAQLKVLLVLFCSCHVSAAPNVHNKAATSTRVELECFVCLHMHIMSSG